MQKILYKDFQFVENSGLYHGSEFLIAANFYVIQKREIILEDERAFTDYLVRAEYINARPPLDKWVSDLKNIDFWEFEVNDIFLTSNQRKLILFKLLCEAEIANMYICYDQGSGIRKISEKIVYVQGQHVFPKNIEKDNGLQFIPAYRMKNCHAEFDISEWKKYFDLLPGVSEILFFDSLYAVVKPFIAHAVDEGGFTLALVGPSGHFKTTLVKKYSLWLEEKEEQQLCFSERMRDIQIKERLTKLAGQNYLLDDLRRTDSRTDNIRQSERLDSIVRYVNTNSRCANVILTGETLADMGCYSCIDRTLMVSVQQMNHEQSIEFYNKICQLPDGFMASLAIYLAEVLAEHSSEVLEEIRSLWKDDLMSERSQTDLVCRLDSYRKLLKFTERLCGKYCGIEGTSERLELALKKQAEIQCLKLKAILQRDSPSNYIVAFYEIINSGKYIHVENDQQKYTCQESTCLLHRKKIYITTINLKNALYMYYKKYTPPSEVVKQLHYQGILEEEPNGKGMQRNCFGTKHYVVNLCFLISYLCEIGYAVSEENEKEYLIQFNR